MRLLATEGVDDALEPTIDTVESLYEGFWANLPILVCDRADYRQARRVDMIAEETHLSAENGI